MLTVVAVIVVASYRFSTRQHMEVVEHKPPLADIPGATVIREMVALKCGDLHVNPSLFEGIG